MAENDTIIDNPTEPDWFKDMVSDDTPPERVEFLKSFDTQEALIDSAQTAKDANWRDPFAGDDDKFKSQLERFGTPADMGKAFREAQGKISSGNIRTTPDENATPDDLAAYRTANGIPAEVDGYFKDLPEGLVIGEADKEIFTDFAGEMHNMHVAPDVMHKVIGWYNKFAENQQDQMAELDAGHHQETEDTMRSDWGTDYRANVNLIGSYVEANFGKEAAESLLGARDGQGRAIMNIPGILEGFANTARKMNPVGRITPVTNQTAIETLNEEIKGIEDLMRTDRPKYNKDQKIQDRYVELLDIRIEHEKKTA